MKRWATTLLLALFVGAGTTAPAHAQFTWGGHDETTEDLTSGTAWNAAVGAAATPGTVPAGVTGTHLLVTEVGMRGLNTLTLADSSEFVEIYNPTSCTIDLSKVYLSDVNAYWTLPVAGTIDLAGNNTDFAMKFPAGSSIAPGQVVVIAIDGGRFKRATGVDANYQMFNAGGVTTAQTMVDVAVNKGATYPAFGSFTNGGEFVWLFHWDGAFDHTTDLDLVYWPAAPAAGANAPARKLGTNCQDGPDPGSAPSCYTTDLGNPSGSMGRGLAVPASGAGTRQRIGAEAEAGTTGGNGAVLAPSAVGIMADLNPSTCGGKVNFTATLEDPAATGTVTFLDNGSPVGSAAVTGGTATLSVTFTEAGTHTVSASYSGDVCHGSGFGSTPQQVDPNPSSTSLTADINPSLCGQKVTLTATVSPFDGSGNVTFFSDGNPLGTAAVVAGTATLSVTDLAGGSHILTANFSGGGCAAASTSPDYKQDVNPVAASVAVTSDMNPSTCGDKVNFTATVTPPGATGNVVFYVGPDPLGMAALDANGQATFSATSELYTGSLTITAQYGGDACHAAANSPDYIQTVNAATPVITLTSDTNPSGCGGAVGFDATITPAFVVGDLVLYDGATPVATSPVDGGGNAHFSVTFTGTGTHTMTVQFAGDFCTAAGSSAPLDQTVDPAVVPVSLVSDANPSTCGQRVTLTATVAPGATGTVSFYDGATLLETVALDGFGIARHADNAFTIGSHTITAVYSGDGCYSAATSGPVVQVVDFNPTATALTSDVNPSACGAKVTLTATVTAADNGANGLVARKGPQQQAGPTLTGSVTFFDGATPLGSVPVDANGVATLSVTSFISGGHALTAAYGNDGCNGGSTSPVYVQVVNATPSSVVVTSDINPSVCGQVVTFTATVTPVGATGTVTFFVDGSPVATVPVDAMGHATYAASFPGQPPTHIVTAQYGGDGCVSGSLSPDYEQRVDQIPTTVAVTSDASPLKYGGKVNFTATVTPSAATGVVTFFDGANFLGQATVVAGAATLSVTTSATFGVGSHDITATYNGDDCYAPSTSPILVQVVVPDYGPAVVVVYPNGGENFVVGMHEILQWTATDDNAVANVSLYVSRDYGATWETLALGIPNTGSFDWVVTPPGTNMSAAPVYSCLFRVVAYDDMGQPGDDASDAYFSIFDFTVAVVLTRLDATPAESGIAIRWALQNATLFDAVTVERAESEAGPWTAIQATRHDEGDVMVAVDTDVSAAHAYWYRLVGVTTAGARSVYGPVKGTAAAPRAFALAGVWPNPSRGAMRTVFSLPRTAQVRLSVIDLQGREVQVLADGAFEAGRYEASWDGRAAGGPVPGGVYFVRYVTPDTKITQRLVITR